MKHKLLIQSISLICFLTGAFVSNSQETRGYRHWSVGASFFTTIGHTEVPLGVTTNQGYANFKGLSIDAAYKLDIYRSIYLRPGVSLYYAAHGRVFYRMPDDDEPNYCGRIREYGFGLKLPIGIHLPLEKISFDIESGPTSSTYLSQQFKRGRIQIGGLPDIIPKNYKFHSNRFMLRWMFGINTNFWEDRIFIKLNFELPLTKQLRDKSNREEEVKGRSVFTVGLGCNF